MGNSALKAVCVRDDSLDMYTDELVAVESYVSTLPQPHEDNDTSDKSFNDAQDDLKWDANLVSLHLRSKRDVIDGVDETRSAMRQRRRRSPLKVLRSIVSPCRPTQDAAASPHDAYDEVCDQFNVMFYANTTHPSKISSTISPPMSNATQPPQGTEEAGKQDSDLVFTTEPQPDLSLDGLQTPRPSLADWPAHTWKIEGSIAESPTDDDDMCSTACSSEYATDIDPSDDEDDPDAVPPPSTFACSPRRSVSATTTTLKSQDDIPFVFAARSQFIVADYLCPCHDCPWYSVIEKHVRASGLSTKAKGRVVRVLQAYSTYNEVTGFRPGMVQLAQDCLFTSRGHENDAFESFVHCVESRYANGWL
ncbi:hypothetical protein DYB38_004848 [Aphanomyces astaci]|uniref:Uncharacterized protein n=1 Tax=Aphanomyces astaci TaxID=112090 RepID=A0A397CUS4_APHAT|nr:hypothetical protein DYB38_004848 [Aphanomyces astaci]